MDLATGANDSIATIPTFTPSILGLYKIDYLLVQNETDINPSDNNAQQIFEVTYSTYARDMGGIGASFSNSADSYEIGNPCEIIVNDEATSISVYVEGTSVPAVLMYRALYRIDASGNYIYMDQTSDYALTAADLDSWVTLNFATSVALTAAE